MVKTKTYKGQWKSTRAEAKYREKEAIVWARAKRKPEAIDVATRFGSTRAYRWSGTGPPIVFIHGMTDVSVRWIPFAEALDGHDVYAIDIMGDVGQSKPDIGFASADDYAVWLGETLDGLGITKPHLAGESLGGSIALSYAMRPDSVRSVIGFEPAGVVDFKLMRLMGWSMRVGLASFAPAGIKRRLAKRLRQPILNDKAAMALVLQAQRGHPIKLPPVSVLTDDQLRSITAPMRVLGGAHSKAFDSDLLVDRINAIAPRGRARLIADAGHALTISHFDDCLAVVREVLALPVDQLSEPASQPNVV